jgi:hypothetical protein
MAAVLVCPRLAWVHIAFARKAKVTTLIDVANHVTRPRGNHNESIAARIERGTFPIHECSCR